MIDTPIDNLKILAHSALGRNVALREVAKWWEETSAKFAAKGDEIGAAAATKHAEHYRKQLASEDVQ